MAKDSKQVSAGAAAVARKGIAVGTTQGPRAKDGTRFPESARKSAQTSVRSALAKRQNRTQ